MKRKIIQIDESKCNGCGACATACHEGAIGMVNGKAKLLRDDFCDGFGDCLPQCPTGAISFVEREAAAYDEKAVLAARASQARAHAGGGCPGMRMRTLHRPTAPTSAAALTPAAESSGPVSELAQWPCQIRLVPVNAPYFSDAALLVAADCTAFACASFHRDFMRGKVTLVGCPKLDAVDYSEKLADVIRANAITSVTVVRMEVPCCGGLESAARRALQASGKSVPFRVVTLALDGHVLGETTA